MMTQSEFIACLNIDGKDKHEFGNQSRKSLFCKELKDAAVSGSSDIILALLAYSLLRCGKAYPKRFSA